MLQPRRAHVSRAIESSLASLAASLDALSLCPRHVRSQLQPAAQFVRHASHAAQGRANGPKDTAGRRLGAKKSASEYVVSGNIIFKQRGTKWHPGENCDIGKDHTIYATVPGYVRYYQNPRLHPKRRYIGVALEREGPMSQLPTPYNAPTRRRLGMHAAPIASDPAAFLEQHLSEGSKHAASLEGKKPKVASPPTPAIILRAGTNRVTNYSIGQAAERKGVVVREYDRGDRWLAWRKRTRKVKLAAIARASKANRKTKGRKVNKGLVRAPRGGPKEQM